LKNRAYIKLRFLPEAQNPLDFPPLAVHSLAVKQVPFIVLVVVEDAKMH
jgi:hypothetical protein